MRLFKKIKHASSCCNIKFEDVNDENNEQKKSNCHHTIIKKDKLVTKDKTKKTS